jgi:aspartate kinase
MIVMKFGGSSVESSEAILRVCRIVKTHRAEQPVVVVSAIGKTTNQLIELAARASRGDGYSARKHLNAMKEVHHRIADDLLQGARHAAVTQSLQNSFREIHSIIHELSEDGRTLTPALSDYIASFGERLSSEIVAAALAANCVPSTHLDARECIVTDDHHGSAAPLDWQTYARLRRAIPHLAGSQVVVMGGFIGASESGVTTTLGRGGSDLTASLVGAGIAADEIQIWTDVDGMLTCDPRIAPAGHRVHSISYDEASAMAAAGAKVLHPDTVKPAIRQRIPVVIRNSRHAEREGTRIVAVAEACTNPVKTVAARRDLIALEITSNEVAPGPELVRILHDFCYRRSIEPALLCYQGDALILALNSADIAGEIEMEFAGCVQVRLRNRVALISLIGPGAGWPNIAARALAALRGTDAVVVANGELSLSLLVPQQELRRSVLLLHGEFFKEIDPTAFSPVHAEQPENHEADPMLAFTLRRTALLASFGYRPV